jgi:diguanylate cyclase
LSPLSIDAVASARAFTGNLWIRADASGEPCYVLTYDKHFLTAYMPHPFRPTPPDVLIEVARLLAEAREASTVSDGNALALRAWELAQNGSALDRAVAGYVYCFFQYRLGEVDRVLQLATELLPLLESNDLDAQFCQLAGWGSLVAADAGKFSLSIDYASIGCARAEQWGEPRALAEMLSIAGVCFERSGDPWQGERLCRKGLAVARTVPEPRTLAMSLNNLSAVLVGKFYWLRESDAELEGRSGLAESVGYAREFLQIASEMGDPFYIAIGYSNLSEWLIQIGALEEAEPMIELALALAASEDEAFFPASQRDRCSLAELHLAKGQNREAIDVLLALQTRQLARQEELPADALLRVHHTLYRAYSAVNEPKLALVELEALRVLENKRTVESLNARSERMVTRIEANHSQQKLLEQAHSLASRATKLEEIAYQDELTGLGNRRLLDMKLPTIVDRAAKAKTPLAVVMLDLDFFKSINDTLGHAMGDRVLVKVAELLRAHTRPGDLLARTGGEEFVLALPGIGADAAIVVCERLRLSVSQFHWESLSPNLLLTVSAGVACAPEYDMSTLIERADFAMYRAKRAGRNRVVVSQQKA